MKKTTVIFSVLVDEDKYYIQNIGFPTLYDFLKRQGITRKLPEGIDNNEILLILDRAAKPGVIIEYVGDINNNYNRDQQQINKIKENIKNDRNYLRTRTEIQHVFTENDIILDAEKYNSCVDKRTYIDTLDETVERIEKEINELKNEHQELKSDLEQELSDYKSKVNEKKQKIENEYQELLENIRQSDTIKKENEDALNKLIEEKSKYQKEVDVLIQRYYKGTEINNELQKQIRENRISKSNLIDEIQNLSDEYNDKKNSITEYESKIDELKIKEKSLNEKIKDEKDFIEKYSSKIPEMKNIINEYSNVVKKQVNMELELESWNKLCADFGLDRISMISKIYSLLS